MWICVHRWSILFVTLRITESRRGMNSQFLMFTVKQEGKVVTHGTTVCGGDRSQDLEVHQCQIPQPDVPTVPCMPSHPLMPAFTQHFEYWPTLGALPFTGSSPFVTGGWIRSRHDSILDPEIIVALLDAWWPSMALGLNKIRPMGTISVSHPFTLARLSRRVCSML